MKRPSELTASARTDASNTGSALSATSSRREFFGLAMKSVGVVLAMPLLARTVRAQSGATSGNSAHEFMPASVARTTAASEAAAGEAARSSSAVAITVYKDPGCGCCKEWVKHMQKAGFTVTATDTTDMNAVKAKYGVPSALQSCHTALVGEYVVEGHAPADIVQKMLLEKPNARGIAVPGMPQGSPGMEGPTKDKYNVMLFDRLGKATVYASR